MEIVMPMILQLVKLCVICIVLAVQGSGAHRQLTLLTVTPAPESQTSEGILSPSTSVVSPQYGAAPPSSNFEGHIPSMPPRTSQREQPIDKTPVSVPVAPVPVASPSRNDPKIPPAIQPSVPGTLPPSGQQRNAPENKAPVPEPIVPVPVASPPKIYKPEPPAVHSINPIASPSILPAPVASPTSELPQSSPPSSPVIPGESPSIVPDPNLSPVSTPPTMHVAPSPNDKPEPVPPVNRSPTRGSSDPSGSPASTPSPRMPVAAPPVETPQPVPPRNHSPEKAPAAPSKHKGIRHSNDAPALSPLSPRSRINNWLQSPASSPSASIYKNHHKRNKTATPAPASSYLVSSPASEPGGPVIPLSLPPKPSHSHYASPLLNPGPSAAPSYFPFPSPLSDASPAPSPSPIAASGHTKFPFIPPKISPSGSSSKSPEMPPLPPVLTLPPPPPNQDCSETICSEPYTNTPPGSPCGCVRPMQVGLRLSVSLYTFFPLVSELAKEIAAGVFVRQSQVRIIGANAANQQPEKTVVLIDLVPLGDKFDNTTAFLTYDRFWHKQVVINSFYFGDYEVLYVQYPGLPPSPPSAPSGITIVDDRPYSGDENNGRTIKPIGVDVHKRHNKSGLNGSIIAIIALSAFVAVILCSVVVWVLLFKHREHNYQPGPTSRGLQPSLAKFSGMAGSMIGSMPSSVSLSFGSSIATYTGSAKTYSTSDIEKATNNFDSSRILGEGGFGRVYSGVLEDGTKAAVKVLKRDDQQGGREFLAEVEMLSRLHHRNLVKLIGICTEERTRCLVYELIPNGSVESHLHGADKETSPLDWGARMKIALGAARGLAYLHEDSSPRVIHRDFKSSNILLEHDFTPKVSDFGLARTAMDEEDRHISTRVMGTFGYVAPEYAMTGHLLVKSDVYSYGVVLLELLSGRKPVDMSQPSGQENLVAWARPFLSSEDGLESIIDSSLGSNLPFDSVAKVAAIASMCVQPEVSHRPFMGEVVQALKLVCNECEETREIGSRSSSQEDLSIDVDPTVSTGLGQLSGHSKFQYLGPNYGHGIDAERGLVASELLSASVRFERQGSGSFRRHSSSGHLRPGRGRQFWQRMRRLSGGSASEHEVIFSLWPGSH